jgi:hypothetical protein
MNMKMNNSKNQIFYLFYQMQIDYDTWDDGFFVDLKKVDVHTNIQVDYCFG